jgi:hypothetical protein
MFTYAIIIGIIIIALLTLLQSVDAPTNDTPQVAASSSYI